MILKLVPMKLVVSLQHLSFTAIRLGLNIKCWDTDNQNI